MPKQENGAFLVSGIVLHIYQYPFEYTVGRMTNTSTLALGLAKSSLPRLW
jgi:hypothetical protein